MKKNPREITPAHPEHDPLVRPPEPPRAPDFTASRRAAASTDRQAAAGSTARLPPRCQPASALKGPRRAAVGQTLAGGSLREAPSSATCPDSHRARLCRGSSPRGPSKIPPSSHGGTVWRVTQGTVECPERFTLGPGGDGARRDAWWTSGGCSKTTNSQCPSNPSRQPPTSLGSLHLIYPPTSSVPASAVQLFGCDLGC